MTPRFAKRSKADASSLPWARRSNAQWNVHTTGARAYRHNVYDVSNVIHSQRYPQTSVSARCRRANASRSRHLRREQARTANLLDLLLSEFANVSALHHNRLVRELTLTEELEDAVVGEVDDRGLGDVFFAPPPSRFSSPTSVQSLSMLIVGQW